MTILKTLAAVSLALAATNASALNCVGGPRFAFYAFTDPNDAFICTQQIAQVSQACAENVKTGNCTDYGLTRNTVNPYSCTCPGQTVIGNWTNFNDANDAADAE
jgi:hypothetical protein